MASRFSKRSRNNLKHVHPDLIIVASTAILITPVDFIVTEGLRGIERQRRLFNEGASWTMNSRHLMQPDGFAHAFDVVAYIDGDVRWEEKVYQRIADAMFKAARWHNIKIEWGASKKIDSRGVFNESNDMPHWQLPRQ